MSNSAILITGAASGLGLAITQYLLSHSPKLSLVLGVRTPNAPTITTLRTIYPDATINALSLDLSSQSSIVAFMQAVKKTYSHIDVAIMNAGMHSLAWENATDPAGREKMFQVNFAGNALLSALLLPLLKKSETTPARLTFVSSQLQSSADHPPPEASVFEYYNSRATFKGTRRYGASKLLLSLWARELGAHLDPEKEVMVNSVCPGFLQSAGLDRNLPFGLKQLVGLWRRIGGDKVEVGAKTVVETALEKNGQGAFWIADKKIEVKGSKEFGEKVWKETVRVVEAVEGGGEFVGALTEGDRHLV